MDYIITNNEPRFVRVKDFRIDADYAAWLSEIKRRYISAQIRASIKINTEKLRFNWSVGSDLVIRKADEKLPRLMAELQKIESPYLINMSQPVAVLTGEQSSRWCLECFRGDIRQISFPNANLSMKPYSICVNVYWADGAVRH